MIEVNILLAFLHWVGIALYPWPFVSDIAIFVLKGDVKLQQTNLGHSNILEFSWFGFTCVKWPLILVSVCCMCIRCISSSCLLQLVEKFLQLREPTTFVLSPLMVKIVSYLYSVSRTSVFILFSPPSIACPRGYVLPILPYYWPAAVSKKALSFDAIRRPHLCIYFRAGHWLIILIKINLTI